MIDLHCHILPSVDDGSQDMEESIEMARMAWESGTDTIVATPHCCRPTGWNGYWADEILWRLREFRRELKRRDIPLRLYSGMEVFASSDLAALYRQKKILTLADSRYLLLEFFFDEDAGHMNEAVEGVCALGLTPLIAHPERYDAVQRQPSLAAFWFRQGCLLQLNKGSILGRMGSRAQRAAWWLLRRGLAHVVASDAHGVQMRTTPMDEVSWELRQELGSAYTEILLVENPNCVLRDRPVIPPAETAGDLF